MHVDCCVLPRLAPGAEKYFEMSRKQCKEALDLYKKFVVRMEGVAKMLKVAEVIDGCASPRHAAMYICDLPAHGLPD